ncbi:alpha/beta hydrolase fold domain-containing protein [Microbacterium marinilacus]|uniref:Alpha/beta hydrolase fold-3 domain-containing protein n=1 Tax=Microbacterium marinilacus TaxID=415209 RepID=A0ABP7BS56_9MICO|nr:alpha/beta hydrolase fold domain-containing protein [Microbacterium marinilacus]MBY0689094.1 alpha/beta hydrolase [Microbacterium marinilacus]
MIVPDARLQRLLDAVRSERVDEHDGEPPFARDVGESAESWRRRVVAARAIADAAAVARRAIVDRAASRLFGVSLRDLLPGAVPLIRGELRVNVTAADELGDLAGGLPDGVEAFPGHSAGEVVRVSVTRPETASGAVIVRLHGGAFWMGGGAASDQVDALLIDALASTTGATVLNVDHRLAPEHPFPAAIVDVMCVLRDLRDGSLAEAIGHDVDPARIALVGTSSGSNIVTAAAMADGRANPAHPLAALALIVPSMLLNDAPGGLRRNPVAWSARQRQLRGYLGAVVDADSPWVSPGMASTLPGMPPTFAAIAAYDEVAMGGHEVCRAIVSAGSPALAREYIMTHTVALPEEEAAMFGDITSFLGRHL